ncbi:hypothetical protein TELCIR_05467 [Teladorsagia circumcincta]|uniref:Uncharacterized protein n=1 Tax=Teladorsagia circumcincta TaxID=45464 RepID=A0A2G9UR27_TELCI|nr:hypothetical protein TELCIR_05467 [Teladorsagia circumcincta]
MAKMKKRQYEDNEFTWVPNYIATLLSVVQLSLFVIYPRRPTFVEMEEPLYAVNRKTNHDL